MELVWLILTAVLSGAMLVTSDNGEDLFNDWVSDSGAIVPPKERAKVISMLKEEDDEKDLEYLGTFLPGLETEKEQLYKEDNAGEENDASGQYLGPTLMEKEYRDAMDAGEKIPDEYDAYAEGLVTKGKKQKGQVCHAYAATNVLETCYLKATTSNKFPKPDPYKPETILEFQGGLDLADKFGLKCRDLAGEGGPSLGQSWRNIAFVKRLSGMS